jgi:hypothetical protein
MEMSAVLVNPLIFSPTPETSSAGDLAVKDEIRDTAISLCQDTKLICHIGHEIGLGFS